MHSGSEAEQARMKNIAPASGLTAAGRNSTLSQCGHSEKQLPLSISRVLRASRRKRAKDKRLTVVEDDRIIILCGVCVSCGQRSPNLASTVFAIRIG